MCGRARLGCARTSTIPAAAARADVDHALTRADYERLNAALLLFSTYLSILVT